MLEIVRSPVAYFVAMIAVLSVASLPPSPPTLMAAKANAPWLLATLAAAAAGVAAVFDYHLVRRVFRLGALERVRTHRLFAHAERWAKVAPFFTVFAFAALPLPFMIPRVLVPLSGYPLRRYALAVALGRWPRIFVIAAFGQLVDVPEWLIEALFAGGIALAALSALVRKLGWIGGGAVTMVETPEPPARPVAGPPPPPATPVTPEEGSEPSPPDPGAAT